MFFVKKYFLFNTRDYHFHNLWSVGNVAIEKPSRMIFIYFFNICLFLGECKQRRGRQRGTEDLRQALCWQADSNKPHVGLELMNPLWDHDLSWSRTLSRLSHPGAPQAWFLFLLFFNVYLFLREKERQSMSTGGADREGDLEIEAGFSLQATSTDPNVGLELTNHEIVTWAKVRCWTDWATQAPLKHDF